MTRAILAYLFERAAKLGKLGVATDELRVETSSDPADSVGDVGYFVHLAIEGRTLHRVADQYQRRAGDDDARSARDRGQPPRVTRNVPRDLAIGRHDLSCVDPSGELDVEAVDRRRVRHEFVGSC